jgi:SAM-dependent methyltransferase
VLDTLPMVSALLARLPTPITEAIGLSLRVARAASPPDGLVELEQRGRCASCDRASLFLRCSDGKVGAMSSEWPYDRLVVRALRSRENYFCLWCGRNYRMRGLASVARAWLAGARVFEPASFGVFAPRARRSTVAYETSEFLPLEARRPAYGNPRHEDIQALTLADASVDLVLTSEVFEHVADAWAGFKEVRRVLRPTGRHIFTVPDVPGSPTTIRDPHQPVYHIDPLRPEGALVITDFGDDLPDLLRPLGFETTVHFMPAAAPVLRVFESLAV